MNKILCTIALLFVVTACGSAAKTESGSEPAVPTTAATPAAKPTPVVETVPANGTWTFTQGTFVSEVVVSNGAVEITFGSSSSQLVYWKGTFGAKRLADGDSVISNADTEALEHMIAGSDEKQLTFKYDDHRLICDLTVQGVTKTVSYKK